MKISKNVFVAAVAAFVMSTVGCTKDVAENIAGTYDGIVTMSVRGETQGDPTEAKVIIASESENTVSITLPQMGEGRVSIPSFTVTGVSVAKNGKVYNIEKENISATVESMQITGSLVGNVESGKLNMSYSLKPGAMPMNIDFTFAGK
jgi:hypothetical protein